MKVLVTLFRIILGLVFMFSGFVKGVDPLGFAYKLEDYFIAYGWDGMMPLALALSVFLCTVEFSLGALLVFKVHVRLASFFVFLMMLFFTFLTLYDAVYSPVPDCGCFGDAIKLTNWQTFYKNLFLLPIAWVVFYKSSVIKVRKPLWIQWVMALLIIGLFAGLSTYCYRHLPIIDFTEWKIGNKLYADNPKPVNYYLKYKNNLTGEEKEYLSPNYPYNDSTWMAQWTFVSQRVEDPNLYHGKGLIITDTSGFDLTQSIIRNPGYQVVVTSSDLKKADEKGIKSVLKFCMDLSDANVPSVILVASENSQIADFAVSYNVDIPVYQADDILLKTMVRSNPGVMLLKDGHVMNKWHYRDLPTIPAFLKKYPVN